MKTLTSIWGLVLAGSILLFSCSQDAIFYTIQYDKVLNKDPTIPGGPGSIIKIDKNLYVASNVVYRYKDGVWARLPAQPGGKKIMALAGTDDTLYALAGGGSLWESALYRMTNPGTDGSAWTRITNPTGFSNIQSIYGAGDTLFAGAYSSPGDYRLLYADQSDPDNLRVANDVYSMLKAAAKLGSTYYVAISGVGLLKADDPASLSNTVLLEDGGSSPGNFLGLIKLNDTNLLAVSSSGLIWRIESTGVVESKNYNTPLNGIGAVWKDPNSGNEADLLLLGRAVPGGSSTTTYYYGYSELPIDFSSGNPVLGSSLQPPGLPVSPNPYTSVSKYDTYYNTLGTHPVTSLYQAPDGNVLFASTQQDGLWSCKEWGDPKEWNVE